MTIIIIHCYYCSLLLVIIISQTHSNTAVIINTRAMLSVNERRMMICFISILFTSQRRSTSS
jgi:hypothetical protein